MCNDAIAKTFSVERNLGSWAAVGAVPLTIKCLSNNNVHHNVNDKNDPQYQKYQIIQPNNDYSCTQLLAMGFDANLLKTKFKEHRIRVAAEELDLFIMVANTFKQQEALAKATMYGEKFYVTGGEHINSYKMFIAAEMGNWKREIVEMEKNQEVQIEFHARCNATLIVLDRLHHELDGNVKSLSNKELEVLLRWKGILVSNMGNLASMRLLYQ